MANHVGGELVHRENEVVGSLRTETRPYRDRASERPQLAERFGIEPPTLGRRWRRSQLSLQSAVAEPRIEAEAGPWSPLVVEGWMAALSRGKGPLV
jgi:hypothetical protein